MFAYFNKNFHETTVQSNSVTQHGHLRNSVH